MADIQHSTVVSANPVDTTPHVLDGVVNAIAVVGQKVIVGGEFTQVRNAAANSQTISRTNLFAYDRMTGQIDQNFVPQVDGVVSSLETGANGTVYVGGLFNTVNGQTARRLTQLNVANGTRNQTFTRAQVNFGDIFTIVRRANHLYIGGRFDTVTDTVTGAQRHILARLDAESGAIDTNFNITVS